MAGKDIEIDRLFSRSSYPEYEGQIKFSTRIDRRKPEYQESEELHPVLKERLEDNGVRLYKHQAEALDNFLNDENVCITTSTASGKTLAYALCLAHLFYTDPGCKALLVFPTKALTRDQKKELEGIFSLLGLDLNIGIYDGDVSSSTKRKVRRNADLILTNFTGLNLYMNHHDKWSDFYERLRTVVIDEAHYYTGLLGMHVAWIIRRLRRVARYYSRDPRFILSSATLGNPEQHSKNLVGREFTVIDKDGSERGARKLMFWNPPLLDDKIGERRSTHRESTRLFAHLVNKGFQTLMFAPSRKMTELDALWAEEHLEEEYDNSRAKVKPYHAGHSKEERRKTEKGLKERSIDGVISTTALELGINIGSVDVTLLSGYPGTRISFWQQIGRAGRGIEEVLSALVPFNSALDQYIVDNPEYLLGRPIEDAVIDLSNNQIFSDHLLAAASELPIRGTDKDLFPKRLKRAAEMWKREGSLTGNLRSGYRYSRRDFPQQDINIYSTNDDRFEVQIRRKNSIDSLPPVGRTRAYRDFHEGAIYLHQGEYYQVEEFKEGAKPRVVLKPVDTDYYTVTLRHTDISQIKSEDAKEIGGFKAKKGRATVSIHYYGYKRKKLENDEVLSTKETGLEPVTIDTQVSWLEIPDRVTEELLEKARESLKKPSWSQLDDSPDYHLKGALHASEHVLIHMLPLLMLIDEKDVGGISTDFHPEIDSAGIFIYDGVEGGVGFSHDAYERLKELIEKSKDRLEKCNCGNVKGCPACTYSADCGNDNDPLNRPLAVELLDMFVK